MDSKPDFEAIFHEARSLAAGPERDAYLEQACGIEAERARIEALLRADTAVGERFLERKREPSQESKGAPRAIGPYRILQVLGHGAQATVYQARHDTLRRTVALKVLHRPLLGASNSVARFRREAEVTASLEEPEICSIYEFGETDGAMWIAMQFVPGRTLADYLKEGRATDDGSTTVQLPESSTTVMGKDNGSSSSGSGIRSDVMRIVAFIEDAARALHVAHEHGLVHRDIKPGNLMVTDNGRPVILDFGIASTSDDDQLGLTLTKDVLGTPHYLSPEQLRSGADRIDGRADVYALGVTLFECLTGRRPFDGVSIEALYQQILTTDPSSPRALNAQIPRDLEVVLQTAIEKDRNRRYPCALDFAEDLNRVRNYEPIRAQPISPLGRVLRWARRYPALAISASVTLISLGAGLGASLWFLRDATEALHREQSVRAGWYDDLSKAVAEQDLSGGFTSMQKELQERALVMIDADVPGFRRRIEDIRSSSFERRFTELPSRNGEALIEVCDQLDQAKGACASDWLHVWARVLMSEQTVPWKPREAETLIRMTELSVAQLRGYASDDLRVVRARLLLLDASLESGRIDHAAELASSYVHEEEGRSPIDSEFLALYQSRFGAAQLRQGHPSEARTLLVASVPVIAESFPNTWLAFGAQAYLLALYDKLDEPDKAARLRAELSVALTRATNASFLTTLTHWMPHVARTAIGPDRRELWQWQMDVYQIQGRVPIAQVDRILARLDELLGKLVVRDGDPVHGLFFWTFAYISQATRLRPAHPLVLHLRQRSIEMAEKAPPPHDSEMYLMNLANLGRLHTDRYELKAAAEVLATTLASCPPRSRLRSIVQGYRGHLLSKSGQYERAEEFLCKSFATDLAWYGPTDAVPHSWLQSLVQLYRSWGRGEDTIRWHRQQLTMRDRAVSRARLAFTLLSFGDLDAAEEELERAHDLDPEDPFARQIRGYAALLRRDFTGAIEIASSSLAKGEPFNQRFGERIWARALFASRRAGASIAHFEAAAKAATEVGLAPDGLDGIDFWRDYGLALVATQRVPDACRVLAALTEAYPFNPYAWAARADFLATAKLSSAQNKRAVECAQEAAKYSGGRRARELDILAKAQFSADRANHAQRTMTRLLELMAGRDAQWLAVDEAREKLRRYAKDEE